MMVDAIQTTAQRRRDDELRECLGSTMLSLLAESDVNDIMRNPDGGLWVDRASSGRSRVGSMADSDVETILRLVAFRRRKPITVRDPIIDNGTLPITNERIAGTIDPVTEGPSFAIRIPPRTIMTDFPDGDRVSHALGESEFDGDNLAKLRRAVDERKNIAITGSTGSGKTSLISLLLRQMVDRRVLVFEDTKELMIDAADHVRFLAIKGVASVARLLEMALRYRPDSIVVGELRTGDEARVLVQSANTGHRGTVTGFHANTANEGLNRLHDLCSNASGSISERAIRSAIDVVAHVERIGGKRCITSVVGA